MNMHVDFVSNDRFKPGLSQKMGFGGWPFQNRQLKIILYVLFTVTLEHPAFSDMAKYGYMDLSNCNIQFYQKIL